MLSTDDYCLHQLFHYMLQNGDFSNSSIPFEGLFQTLLHTLKRTVEKVVLDLWCDKCWNQYKHRALGISWEYPFSVCSKDSWVQPLGATSSSPLKFPHTLIHRIPSAENGLFSLLCSHAVTQMPTLIKTPSQVLLCSHSTLYLYIELCSSNLDKLLNLSKPIF